MPRLILSFLGPASILLDGGPIIHLTAKTQALLCYLAVESEHPHRRASLAGLLWPEQPEETARNSLRQALHQLQHAIGESFLRVTPQTVQFNPASDHFLDVARFTALIAECQAHPHRSSEACRAWATTRPSSLSRASCWSPSDTCSLTPLPTASLNPSTWAAWHPSRRYFPSLQRIPGSPATFRFQSHSSRCPGVVCNFL